MLRAGHVAQENLKSNLVLAKCKLGKYGEVSKKAIKEAAAAVSQELWSV
jgi:hypothetical protein